MVNNDLFTNVDHINICCRNLEESIKFYTEVLGFQVTGRKDDLKPVSQVTLVNVSKNGVTVELAGGHDIAQLGKDGMTNHIGLRVTDIFAAHEHLKKHNVELLNPEPVKVKEYFYYFFFRGPSGEKLEVIQHL